MDNIIKNVSIFDRNKTVLRVPKSQISFTEEKSLPAICFFCDKKKVGIALEEDKENNYFLVETNPNITFTYCLFDESDIPTKVGEELYIKNDGKLTKEKGSNKLVGEFLSNSKNAVLFRLKSC